MMWRPLCGVVLPVLLALAIRSLFYEEKCPKTHKLKRWLPAKVALGPRASEDAWPMKLGDMQRTSRSNRTGPRDLKQPRWSFFLPSITYNTPLVDRSGNIYILTTWGSVVSLDPNGEPRWYFQTKVPDLCNPVLQDGALYFSDSSGLAHALAAQTGAVLWQRHFARVQSAGNWAITVGEGLVIAHCHLGGRPGSWTGESEFVALNRSSGDEVWRSRVDSSFFNVIMAFSDGGASLVVTDQVGGTFKMETKTGRVIWSAPGFPFPLTPEAHWYGGRGGAPRTHSALALVDLQRGVVYSGGNPSRHTGRVRALSLETGEELWQCNVDKMLGNNGALADIDGVPTLVFGAGITCQHPIPESKPPFKGTVYGLHAETGAIRWTFEAPTWDFPYAAGSVLHPQCVQLNLPDAWNSPTIDGNGTVYIGWHGGIMFALDGRSGAVISEHHGGEGIQAQAAIGPSGELIVVGAQWTHSFWPDDS
mmetsp:Transcript_23949/g.65267  ORF Transcript_23949/g.65267 Transcript_23949/m.65267 type:complete len:476 (-) Transcript_23949:44-1471(-)|eukprot:CAMPEP_0171230600 /NCGR_PEP_ID=MMETSP0790-20130122/39480_1 /TAXON_ID=2925 /ORGANISM="Alexandrium catenella, Strain OF101" /LENGTH=475 /DNA_ID=CAMNT_0011696817 /DNA_START=121 /DNA_END=1548 /DNA_ORIENTATION=-